MSNPTSRGLLAQAHLVVTIAPTALELIRSGILIWVVLVSVHAPDVVLVVHVISILLGLVVGTLAVPGVHAWEQISHFTLQTWSMALYTLGLGKLVNFTTNESSKEFLGEGVFHDFAWYDVSPDGTHTQRVRGVFACPLCVGGLRRA